MTEEPLTWQRICGTAACPEVAVDSDGNRYVRNSAEPDTVVKFNRDEWFGLVEAIHRGEIA